MKNQKFTSVLVYALVSLLVLLGLFAGYIYVKIIKTDTFAPGVEIGGIPVQGENMDTAVDAINRNISEVYATPVTFYKDDYAYESTFGDLCLPINAQELVETVWQEEKTRNWGAKFMNMHGRQRVVYPIALPYDPGMKNKLVQEWSDRWGTVAQNASLEITDQGKVLVVPGHDGTEIDAEATFDALPREIDEATVERVPIVVINKEPSIGDSILSNMGLLSTYTTKYNTVEINRSHNLSIAASSIDEKLVAPNEVFSFNNTIGECSAERGYREAMVIVAGKFEPGLAGGICQVSSTLYNATLLAGMDIVERHNHSLAVVYVPLGRDATVSNGSCDFQFRNNTDYPVFIRASASNGRLTITIYGDLSYKKKIEIYNIIDETLDYITITEPDPNLKPGEEIVDHNGQLGYVVRSFRSFYNQDGEIIETELISRDRYTPLNKLVYVGPQTDPASQPDTGTPGDQEPDVDNPPVEWVRPPIPTDPDLIRP